MHRRLSQWIKGLICLLTIVFFSHSCDDSSEPKGEQNIPYIEQARKALIMELIVNDLESIVLNAMINLDLQDPGGTIDTHIDYNIFSLRGNCAREIDADNNRLTLKLNSCVDAIDILRAGDMIVAYDDSFDRTGNLISVQLVDYQYENVTINGDFTILNTSEVDSEEKKYEITFPQTSLKFTDSTLDFDFSGTRSMVVREIEGSIRNPDIESRVDVDWKITEQGGEVFKIEDNGYTQYRLDCWADGFYLPRAGVQEVSGSDFELTIDYYKSGCGHEFAILTNGNTFENLSLEGIFEQ
ncbi:hypothetical protein [Roseivirga sp. E12]|uniref:hypothetical protein n=1 Tax=Roseivirga sp. E12 TaxID=2819237 RepID=UPI001ABD3BBE|nr:hypothetical protein [Roseivirga sp. E12]MBO3698491.1 hypothetical protein [Roseivirga sp. E12]